MTTRRIAIVGVLSTAAIIAVGVLCGGSAFLASGPAAMAAAASAGPGGMSGPAPSSASAMSAAPWSSNVVVPQVRVYVTAEVVSPAGAATTVHVPSAMSSVRPPPSAGAARLLTPAMEITGVDVGVTILEQVATTTMDISLRNLTDRRQEAELLVPVPDKSVVRSFTFQGAAAEPTAELLPKAAAEKTYASIVAKVRDPALLEFAACNLVRSSVFPLEARGTQKVRLTYENLLPAEGNRVDYELPRSEALDYAVPWIITVRVQSKRAISTIYSPTHGLDVRRAATNVVSARLSADATKQPGPFRLSYLAEADGVAASLFAYPDAKTGGGYFLLLAGVPATPPSAGASAIRREVTLVLDRSGSMNGGKIAQVREAARQIIGGLADGETFNIIAYNDTIEQFSGEAVAKDKDAAMKYIDSIQARGGTNIYDALAEALRPTPRAGSLPIVLFLTDGLPTVGQTSEAAIRDVALKANPHNRRIFTFGVGVDVNTPLLEKIAAETRGMATFVMPKEDVEVKVAQVFKRLAGPVLADPRIITGEGGRVTDLVPSKIPDVFADDQLVMVGRYVKSDEPLLFELTGNYLGKERRFRFRFDLASATTRNAFVPRLWASRRIAVLVDAIRQMGAGGPGNVAVVMAATDPHLKELVDEVVRLSTEFGILTEYTAFLAREGTDLTRKDEVLAQASRNFLDRAIATRSGVGSVNQESNLIAQRSQATLNMRNAFLDQNMDRVSTSAVQQINDRAFYRRGNQWIDSRLINEKSAAPAETIEYGTEAYQRLVGRLTAENRSGTIAQRGDVLMLMDGKAVLIKAPSADPAPGPGN